MRINLKVPFAQKDAAKALGARWDGARKIWYVIDPRDLAPFSDWSPQPDAAVTGVTGAAVAPALRTAPRANAGIVTGPATVRTLCACAVLPWEPCSHTQAAT